MTRSITLTHIGFTEDPKSVEVDKNVDTNLAAAVTGIDAIVGSHSHTNPATGFGAYKFLPTTVAGPNNVPVIINHAYRYNNTLGELVLGMRAKAGGGYEVVSRTGRYLSVTSGIAEDAAIKSIVDPYVAALATYNNTEIGQTTVPLDASNAYIDETNVANLQADAAIHELGINSIPEVDFHLSGAMTRPGGTDPTKWVLFPTATEASPATIKVSDMFTLMPYENSLVVLNMNGPQIKAVLERAYRNYYYYKYVPGYGGYSFYTTCMIDTDFGNQVVYNDTYPALPDGNNVAAMWDGENLVDFTDATTYYRVSTVNYLAAGSCNFNDGGVSLWPLNQIANDTQYYVRDAVIHYIQAQKAPISPAIEGRLQFLTVPDVDGPMIDIVSPTATPYLHPNSLTIDFSVTDAGSGVKTYFAKLDGVVVTDGQVIDLYTLALGDHTFTVNAWDLAGNASVASVTFTVIATPESLMAAVEHFYEMGAIKNAGIKTSLIQKLENIAAAMLRGQENAAAGQLGAFINELYAQSGKQIDAQVAELLIADAKYVLSTIVGPLGSFESTGVLPFSR